ncbi:MAG: CoA-binding protein [Chloroflexi bacterium]|nr:CoA-binding protein [Chloroflexota bacterium]
MVNLSELFHPRSIAVVGASADERPGADTWLSRLVDFPFPGPIYPVNPRAQEILGLKAYSSIKEIPDPVDYVIIIVPAPVVPQVMADCAAKGVKVVHIFSAGFREAGTAEGERLEAEVVKIARQAGIQVLGPNCMGIYCPGAGLTNSRELPGDSGSVAFVSQSGGHAIEFARGGAWRGLRFSKVISYGNGCDLTAEDFLDYLADDPETQIIGAYIEGLRDGRRFMKAARHCVETKPLIILKSGFTKAGSRAALSHTGSLAGQEEVWDTFFRQSGAISVASMEEMLEVTLAFYYLPVLNGPRVGLIGGGGGASVNAADALEKAGLQVPSLSENTLAELRRLLPEVGRSVRNPIDLQGGHLGPTHIYRRALELLLADPMVDVGICVVDLQYFSSPEGQAPLQRKVETLLEVAAAQEKPLAVVLRSHASEEGVRLLIREQSRCLQAKVPVFFSIDAAAKALGKLWRYRRRE